MYTYIIKTFRGYYFEIPEMLTSENYDNLGSTYEDFQNGCFVLLSDEQVQFHKDYPQASIKEVLEMQLYQPQVDEVQLLNQARQTKLTEIDIYDLSDSVNSFTINGVITAWLTPTERANYAQSVAAAKLLQQDTLSFYIGDNYLEVEVNNAERLLAALQLYADKCFIVTKQHKLAVQQLEDIESINNYDYTSGYPDKLNFTI